jgi:hypothetical protein
MHTDTEVERARHYIEQMGEVEGWLSREAAVLITATHVFQRSIPLSGTILEIGVWRGKSGILLCQLIDPRDERCVLSDRFDGGDYPDLYGENNLDVLKDNLSRWTEPSDSVVIEACDSMHLLPHMTGLAGSIRMCHIDGSHQYERTLEDMLMCADLLMPQGCMIVDDAFNVLLLGVNQALNEFLRTSSYAAFGVGFNKAFLCREEHHAAYSGMWTSREIVSILDHYDIEPNQWHRHPKFYGREVAILLNKNTPPEAMPEQS